MNDFYKYFPTLKHSLYPATTVIRQQLSMHPPSFLSNNHNNNEQQKQPFINASTTLLFIKQPRQPNDSKDNILNAVAK